MEMINGIPINELLTTVNRTIRTGRDIRYIVVHYTGNVTDTAYNNARYFKSVNRNASAHYFVDEHSVWRSVADKDEAWAVGRNYGANNLYGIVTNNNSISVELCSTNGVFPETTLEIAATLIAGLMDKYKISINNVHTHFEVCTKACPGWSGWGAVGGNLKWVAFKQRILVKTSATGKEKPVVYTNTQKQYPLDPKGKDFPHYRVHQTKIGWNYPCPVGQGAGCLGFQIEALKIDFPNHEVKAKAHIQKQGTIDYGKVNSKSVIGSVGKKLRLEGVWLTIPGYKARAFCGDKWLPWQKCDGNHLIGTQGKSMPMYSIQIAKE